MNIVDLIAIVPFYITAMLSGRSCFTVLVRFCAGLESFKMINKAGNMVRLVRVVNLLRSQVRVLRILRIFKIIKHFSGLQSLLYTLHQAWKELGVIIIAIIIVLLMFSSLIYALEQGGTNGWLV